jgi:AraC-like DNA-binding protein
MHFAPHEPSALLAPYVQSIFHFKHFMPDHSIERVVPDGHIYLIFELDGFERNTFDNESLEPNATYTRVWLSGLHKHYISISAHEDSEMFVIQFKPGGLQPFLDKAISDVNDSVIPAQQLFGEVVLTLREELLKATADDEKMFALAEEFLLNIASFEQSSARTLVEQMLQAIQKNSASQLQDIVKQAGYSKKQAIHVFKQHVGLNPKSYQRIVRFNEILSLVMEKKSIAWRDICADCYYYDQSHFIREFKAFCGYSPREFLVLQGKHPEANFFPLD